MSDANPRQSLDYATGEQRADARRGARKWTLLLLAWLIGLAVWAIYIGAIIYLFFRFVA